MSNLVPFFPSDSDFARMKEMSRMAFSSGLLPSSIKSAEQACIIMLKGYELGIGPMEACAKISVIQGKPAMDSELMLSQGYKKVGGLVVNFIETTNEKCVIEARRPGGKATRFEFTIEDARRAQLVAKDNWKKFPAAMLRARCISAMARALIPDALSGASYTPEELGAEIDGDGNVEAIPQTAVVPPKTATATSKPVPRDVIPADTKPRDWKEYVLQFGATNLDGEGISPGAHVITFGTRYTGKTIAQAVLAGQVDFEHWLNILVKNYQTAGYDRLKSEHAIVLEKAWLYLRPDEDLDDALDRDVEAMVDREKRIAKGNYVTEAEEREWRQGQ